MKRLGARSDRIVRFHLDGDFPQIELAMLRIFDRAQNAVFPLPAEVGRRCAG